MDGNILCKKLLAKRYRVIGIDKKDKKRKNKNYFFEEGDITNEDFIFNMIHKYKPNYFYNLAAVSIVPKSFDIPREVMKVNTIAVIHMLEMIRKYSPKTRFYQASTSEMIGKGEGNTLKSRMLPITPYACFPKKTKIVCKYKRGHRYGKTNFLGTKNIENIKKGDSILSYNQETGIKELDKVINIMKRQSDIIYKIKFSNSNEITCTGEHPFFIPDGKKGYWKITTNLKIGDRLLQYKYSGLKFRINGNINKKGRHYMYGKKHKLRTRQKISSSLIGRKVWNKGINSKSPMEGKKHSKTTKKKMSWIKKEQYKKGLKSWNKGLKGTYTTSRKGKKITDKSILRKMSLATSNQWKDENKRKKLIEAQNRKINRGEQKLLDKLQEWFPDQFRYVGDGSLWVGNPPKNPDFIHKKFNKVIEYNGSFWHKDNRKSLKREYDFKKNGFDCLTIWDYEMKKEKIVYEKIKTFIYNPNVEIIKISNIEKIEKKTEVYNIETEKNHNYFAYGILVHNCSKLASHDLVRIYREKYGLFAVSGMCWNHEGSDRADYFVTKKISNYVSKGDYSTPLEIGNLDSSRDWGFADEYVDAMILMMEARAPDDYEVNTGEAHTIREFIEEAFRCVEKRVTWIGTGLGEKGVDNGGYLLVKVNKEFYRPSVPHLPGNHDKIKKKLGWAPKVKFKKLVKIMVDSDIKEGD